jgi:hypothetical protein
MSTATSIEPMSQGWDEAFAQMHRDGADKLIIPEFENDFDIETW